MMSKSPIPAGALESDIAIVAQKGAGKTYTMRGLVERLLKAGRRTVILDPLNSWWGLKARANGKAGFPVAVVGGPNADIPLDPAGGEALGAFIAGATMSVVIDVSELKRGEMVRFSIDFLAALYRLNRDPLWLVLEEADVFAPQQPMNDAMRLLHEVDQIARRGRARGFRLWTITQRPAKLHKDVLTQTSTLITMRLRSPQDRAAAEAWIQGNTDNARAREIVRELSSLPTGEGWVWAPDFDILERVKFPPIETLDTSATPEHGAVRTSVGKLAGADLAQLREALAKGTSADRPQPPTGDSSVRPPANTKAIEEAAHQRGFDEGYRRGHDDGEREEWARAMRVANERHDAAIAALWTELRAERPTGGEIRTTPPAPSTPRPSAQPKPVAGSSRPVVKPPSTGNQAGALGLVTAAGECHPVRLTWAQIATLAGRKPRGGHFNASRKTALDQGWLVENGGLVQVTAAGMAAANLTEGNGDVADIFAAALPQPAAKMFAAIRERPGLTLIGLATVLAMQPRGGHWNNGIATLRRNGLLREDGDQLFTQIPKDS